MKKFQRRIEMSITKLKNDLKQKAAEYIKDIYEKKAESYKLTCSIGTKKIDVLIRGNGEKHLVGSVLNVEIESIQEKWMICRVTNFSIANWAFKDYERPGDLVKLVTDYLKEYMRVKKLHGFFIYYDHLSGHYKRCLKKALQKEGLEQQFTNTLLLTKMDGKINYFSYCGSQGEKVFREVSMLEVELNKLHKEFPSFTVDKWKPYPSVFQVNSRIYYYEGENFSLTVSSDSLITVQGSEVGRKEYEITDGVASKILDDIREQKRLFNLINVPCKFTMQVMKLISSPWEESISSENNCVKIINDCDEIVGSGRTEEDMIVLFDVIGKLLSDSESMIKDKYSYLKLESDTYTIYRVKANHAIWFLVKCKGDAFVYPSDKAEVPREVLDFVNKNVEININKFFASK